jgi:hypothetical protein
MYAVELWATCPRVIDQETPSSEASIRSQTLWEQDGNRRFRLLHSPVDCAAGIFHGPVTGTRAEHHGGSAWHFTGMDTWLRDTVPGVGWLPIGQAR